MSDNIKVVVKVRPLISRELEDKLSYQWRVKNNTLYQLDHNGKDFGTSFTFDKVYDEGSKTNDIYNDIAKPIVEAATAGFNGTIFAYGQTSSGKTYTMTGTEASPGIIPLAVCNLFQIIRNIPARDFLVRVSYIEIYNETLKDLLNVDKKDVKVKENHQGDIKVNCTEQVTTSPEEVLKYLKEGEANRQTGATNMNEESSRSHSIFQITIESREHIEGEEESGCVNVSQLNLVDLAGSERAGQTGATGLRFREGTHINKSLSALALVIKQLSEDQHKHGHVNYRDSKLTRILQNSLGGNAKTSIICAVTPAAVEETISTLQFANRAKAIKNKPEVNAVATDVTMIQTLTKQLSKLQSQLESKKNLEVMLETKKNVEHHLQKQIAALQRLILNGFGTRSSMDMMAGTRRKLVPPRRVTISTLHSIDEDPVPSVPKFHTPLLKYNPMMISGSSGFVPIQNTSKLTCLPEEGDIRLITPPPHDKKTNSDEIIDLDSDTDTSIVDVQACSPYHKCYGASKTPPCILRKNAKLAEKNLKDIVELTEREKIYPPKEVELIERLEQNTAVITRLEEEVNALNQKSKEKDLEIDQLKVKITKSNEEMQSVNSAKTDLETLCKEYTTKLTDWEVSYDTLKAKTKRREDELLSLLEEHKLHKKVEETGKLMAKNLEKELNFMDMSKDISLVNSDCESSVTNINDDETSSQVQDLVVDIQNQLTSKNQIILGLEADLISQKQKIVSLERASQDMQKHIDDFKEKVMYLENENSLLKSSIETLNSTIKSQKCNLESANNDIESYNSLIQELHIKLSNRDKISNLAINDNILESMIANEERFIANNENMRNIIHSFKIALDSRNKEIESLKCVVEQNSLSTEDNTLQEQFSLKEKEIEVLNDKVSYLQSQVNENVDLIDKLIQEKTNLVQLEQQLTNKMADITKQVSQLEKVNKEKDIEIDTLKENSEKLTKAMTEKDATEKILLKENSNMNNTIGELNEKISILKEDIIIKDKLIISMNTQDTQAQEYLFSANSVIILLHNIISKITGRTQELPVTDNNLNDAFNSLKDKLNVLEETLTDIIHQKDLEMKKYVELKDDLEISNKTLSNEVSELKIIIEALRKADHEQNLLKVDLMKQISSLEMERDEMSKTVEIKNKELSNLSNDLTNMNGIKSHNESLQSEMVCKDETIVALREKEKSLALEIDKLVQEKDQNSNDFKNQILNLTKDFERKETHLNGSLHEKQTKIDDLEITVKELNQKLVGNSVHIENLKEKVRETNESTHSLLDNILKEITMVISSLNLEFMPESDEAYDNIIIALKSLSNFATHISANSIQEVRDTDEALLRAQETMKDLFDCQNNDLLENMNQMDMTNKSLLSQMEEIREENRFLNENLNKGSELISALKIELSLKSAELQEAVVKTQHLKEHFLGLDDKLKQEIKHLQVNNEKLTARCSELEISLSAEESRIKIQNIDESLSIKESIEVDRCPPSLSSICCRKIFEAIQPSEKSVSSSESNTTIDFPYKEIQMKSCDCDVLWPRVRSVEMENIRLSELVKNLEAINLNLISEQEQVRHEVQLLLEPAFELQKKICSHKTNLSTLTATTYAENKSLRSQVKVLQHHHTRFHKVCQRDLPVVKKQLNDLMTILKGDKSYIDKHNSSFKRYSLPSVLLDNNSTMNNLKNESTFDGELLMLDTNLTLATSVDNTLMGLDQTCLDMTQAYSINDIGGQTRDMTYDNIHNVDLTQLEVLSNDNQKMNEKILILEQENQQLRHQADDYVIMKESIKGAQSSPIKNCEDPPPCEQCYNLNQKQLSLVNELELLSQKLNDVETEKNEIEKKYKNLSLEMPSTDALVKKLTIFDKELQGKLQEIGKLTNMLSSKNRELELMQQENDALSTQVMENITETDDLNKELDDIKSANAKLSEKCSDLEKILLDAREESKKEVDCSQCQLKDEIINSLQNIELHSKLNRSHSESDTSSRYNKICTLQNELHAGREDCKELTEDVATIKNHLDRSNLSLGQNMDLDDSMSESNIFTFTKHFDIPNPAPERHSDMYSVEKVDCINYYVEKTGADKENLDCNVKIIDIMKMFYNSSIMKHSNEVENLINKIKSYEESRNQLETHVNKLSHEYSEVSKKLEEKEHNFQTVANVLTKIRENTTLIKQEVANFSDAEKNTKFVTIFKDKFLKIVDDELGISSVSIFENLIDGLVNKHQNDLSKIMDQYTKLQGHMENVTAELNSVNDNLLQMKSQLTDKENEYNLLKAQKEKIHEISNAVTLDIVKKEQELCQTIINGCKKLVDNNIMCASDIDTTMPLNQNISLLFDRLINEIKKQSPEIEKEREMLTLEIKKSKTELEENQKAHELLKAENGMLKDINRTVTLELVNKENKLLAQCALHDELSNKYTSLVEENKSNVAIIEKTSEEIEALRETLTEKESALITMTSNKDSNELLEREAKIADLLKTAASYKEEIDALKSVNAIIIREKESSELELEKSKEILKLNATELDRVTADILVLRESVKESSSVIETLKSEAKSLLQQNVQLKEQFELKCRDCSRLEMNIKTHEKTAEIQSKMIMRLQKQKEEDDKSTMERKKRLEELSRQILDLQKDNDIMKNETKANREELDNLRKDKEALEVRVLEAELNRGGVPLRLSDADSTRRRRQSIHDSKRMFSEHQDFGDHNKMDAVFESRAKPVDLFMDVDDDSSNRSTPLRTSRGRDSLQSRHDQSEEPVSRPSSVAETRRRRQSIHDLHRSVTQTPSPHERLTNRLGELTNGKSPDIENNNVQSEVCQLRERLSSCQQELEELKERYRELDEECETCAQYLRERDEQCARLKKEKVALEVLVSDLKDKLQSVNPNRSQQEQKPKMCSAAVNTDEDWANLHSVVVDRMSFDAEVEKTKRLTKTVEELRFKKQELKITLGKMQKALERSAARDHSKELEMTKLELKSCKRELEELKEKYKELDEECETCSEYLREREEQCRKLKEAKAALEARLQARQDDSPARELRRKRRSLHDQHRPAQESANAETEISDDFLSYQVERDDNSKKDNEDKSKELKQLKLAVERLSQQKAALEQQLAAPVYVATGSAIVQNQQLTDVMKENQKLKKINTKLIQICKKRGKKPDLNNEDTSENTGLN